MCEWMFGVRMELFTVIVPEENRPKSAVRFFDSDVRRDLHPRLFSASHTFLFHLSLRTTYRTGPKAHVGERFDHGEHKRACLRRH